MSVVNILYAEGLDLLISLFLDFEIIVKMPHAGLDPVVERISHDQGIVADEKSDRASRMARELNDFNAREAVIVKSIAVLNVIIPSAGI